MGWLKNKKLLNENIEKQLRLLYRATLDAYFLYSMLDYCFSNSLPIDIFLMKSKHKSIAERLEKIAEIEKENRLLG